MGLGVLGGGDTLAALGLKYKEVEVDTPFGKPSGPVRIVNINGTRVFTLLRHGLGHAVAAHNVNYRANIWAMKKLGVHNLVGVSVCGCLTGNTPLGSLVSYDQIVDFTRRRVGSFYDKGDVRHFAMSDPVCSCHCRERFLQSIEEVGGVIPNGTIVVVEGPRFSTKAESQYFRTMGWRFINMSAAPEAFLAREAGLCYLPLSLVTDHDVAANDEVSSTRISSTIATFSDRVPTVIRKLIDSYHTIFREHCTCIDAEDGALELSRLNL